MTGRRLVVALAVGLAAVAAPAGSAAPKCAKAGQVTVRANGWTTAVLPYTRSSAAEPWSPHIAVDPNDPARVFATNGKKVFRTVDGGCTWTEVFSVPPYVNAERPPIGHLITSMVIPRLAPNRLLLTYAYGTPGTGSELFVSEQGGNPGSFSKVTAGTPPPTAPWTLVTAASDARVVYLVYLLQGSPVVYASADGGKSFERRTDPPAEIAYRSGHADERPVYVEFAVDPVDALTIWAVYAGRVRRSTDGGRTFAAIDAVRNAVGSGGQAISIFRQPGRPASIVIAPLATTSQPEFATLFRSDDGGTTWKESPAFRGVSSLAHGRHAGSVIGSSQAQAVFRLAGTKWVALSPPDPKQPKALSQIQLSGGSRPAFVGMTTTTIETYTGPV